MNWLQRMSEPFPSLTSLRTRMNRLLPDLFEEADTTDGSGWWPTVDVSETPEKFEVTAEIPGVNPKDIDVTVNGDKLTIQGEKKSEKEEKGRTWYRREAAYGRFLRTIPLPAPVDEDRISAQTKDGVLHVMLPKSEEARLKKITVEPA